MCHAFFERMRKKYDINIDRTKENKELVNSQIGVINEAEAERILEEMSDEKVYGLYLKLFKRKNGQSEVGAYA